MIHSEHLFQADKTYEIRHDNNGNAIHVTIKDGEAIVFPTLTALIEYNANGVNETERFYLDESDLEKLYSYKSYNYYDLKKLWGG